MARDYARRADPHAAPLTAGARGAERTQKSTSPDSLWDKLPAWGWLVLGWVAGLISASLLISDTPPPQTPAVANAIQNAEVIAHPNANADPGHPLPKFDFYTLLPESEVIAPKVAEYKSTPRDDASLPQYMLQVASFRSQADAKQLETRLKEMKLEVKISDVTSTSGDQWYRVQVGPYRDRRKLSRAQDLLARAGLDSLLLKLKDEPEAKAEDEKAQTDKAASASQ